LRADGVFHLVKGSFKAHCESVPSGRSAGCTATGVWNRGLYGVIQYDFYTAVEGYEHCKALNVFVQASQGWFGPKNAVDVYWSSTRCGNNDATCFSNQRRMRDNRKCWQSVNKYDWDCQSKWDYPSARALCDDLEATARIGTGNNPGVIIEVRTNTDPGNTCGDANE